MPGKSLPFVNSAENSFHHGDTEGAEVHGGVYRDMRCYSYLWIMCLGLNDGTAELHVVPLFNQKKRMPDYGRDLPGAQAFPVSP
jgi:hypothetical protein